MGLGLEAQASASPSSGGLLWIWDTGRSHAPTRELTGPLVCLALPAYKHLNAKAPVPSSWAPVDVCLAPAPMNAQAECGVDHALLLSTAQGLV
jgi:hypothetical protein